MPRWTGGEMSKFPLRDIGGMRGYRNRDDVRYNTDLK